MRTKTIRTVHRQKRLLVVGGSSGLAWHRQAFARAVRQAACLGKRARIASVLDQGRWQLTLTGLALPAAVDVGDPDAYRGGQRRFRHAVDSSPLPGHVVYKARASFERGRLGPRLLLEPGQP